MVHIGELGHNYFSLALELVDGLRFQAEGQFLSFRALDKRLFLEPENGLVPDPTGRNVKLTFWNIGQLLIELLDAIFIGLLG
jgi:hypothetical protein